MSSHNPFKPGVLHALPTALREPQSYAQRAEILVRQLQSVVIAEAAQDGPRGLVAPPLDEEGIEEEEAWRRKQEVGSACAIGLFVFFLPTHRI